VSSGHAPSRNGKKLQLRNSGLSRLSRHDFYLDLNLDLISAALDPADFLTESAKLASKKRSRSRPRSRTRSKSRSRSKAAQEAPTYANFVIPLAGILSSITARFYDMGAQSLKSREQSETEHTPLLPESERHESKTYVKKPARWIICNAVILSISMSLLIFVTIIAVCTFFGCKRSISNLPHAIAGLRASTDYYQLIDPQSHIQRRRVFA
jgi:hypothetical protein